VLPSLTCLRVRHTCGIRARPLLLVGPQEPALPKSSDVAMGLLRQSAAPISLKKEEAMADMYTCSCGNQTWQVLEAAVRCTACGTEIVAPHMPVAEFNHMVTQELEEVLEE